MIDNTFNVSFLKFNTLSIIISFLILSTLIIILSINLSKYADALSERKKIDGSLIGLILLAGITSLPELAVSISSVKNLPTNIGCNFAIGNIFGSNLFNLVIMGICIVMFSVKFKNLVNKNFFVNLSVQTILLTVFTLLILNINFLRTYGDYFFLIIPLLYVLFLIINNYYAFNISQKSKFNKLINKNSFLFYSNFILLSFFIIFSGFLMTLIAEIMSLNVSDGGLGINKNLTGTLFLALSTSLPELVIALSCIKIGNINMAYGNILGSNLFNFLIMFITNLFITETFILANISSRNNISLLSILLLSLILIMLIKIKNVKIIRIMSFSLFFIYLLTLSFI